VEQITSGGSIAAAKARISAMHIAKQESGLSQVAIAQHFGISASAMSVALKRRTAWLNHVDLKKTADNIAAAFRSQKS